MAKPNSDRKPPPDLSDLHIAVEQLTEAVLTLTHAVDELTTELTWRNNQSRDRHYSPAPSRLTSMPADPAATDWHLNRFTAEDLPEETPAETPQQDTLFDQSIPFPVFDEVTHAC